MNFQIACTHLKIDNNIDELTLPVLKRQYRLLALTYHPDKNKSPDAAVHFHQIQESYEYLLHYLARCDIIDDDDQDAGPSAYDTYNVGNYRDILFSFLTNILEHDISQNKLLCIIVDRLINICETKSIMLLERIDKKLLRKLYDLLKQYKTIFHFTDDFLTKIEDILNVEPECIILNPSIADLLNDNVYRLTIDTNVFVVPLWHDELVYDISGVELYVQCYPILPPNVMIDDTNNVHIELTYPMDMLWNKDKVSFELGGKSFSFFPRTLNLIPTQLVVFEKQGISRINSNNVYDVSYRGDLIVHLTIIL